MPLGKVVSYISEHYGQPLDNAQLAAVADLSARTLERQFHRHYGNSPRQYIKRLRVRLACHGLAQTDRPIAAEHGFVNQNHFTREFRELLGETPRESCQTFRRRSD